MALVDKSVIKSKIIAKDESIKLKPVNLKSVIWNNFNLVQHNGKLLDFVCCTKCQEVLTYTTRNGTSGMRRHKCFRKRNNKNSGKKITPVHDQNMISNTKRQIKETEDDFEDKKEMHITDNVDMLEETDALKPEIVLNAPTLYNSDYEVPTYLNDEDTSAYDSSNISDAEDNKDILIPKVNLNSTTKHNNNTRDNIILTKRLEIEKKKLQLLEKQFKLDKEIFHEKLSIKKRKLELKAQKMEIEKKLQEEKIKNQYQLKKMELELKEKMFKYESDLKYAKK